MQEFCHQQQLSPEGIGTNVQRRSHLQVGSLEVGRLHRALRILLFLTGVVWETYGGLATDKLPTCEGLQSWSGLFGYALSLPCHFGVGFGQVAVQMPGVCCTTLGSTLRGFFVPFLLNESIPLLGAQCVQPSKTKATAQFCHKFPGKRPTPSRIGSTALRLAGVVDSSSCELVSISVDYPRTWISHKELPRQIVQKASADASFLKTASGP